MPRTILQSPLKIGKTWEFKDEAGVLRYKVVGFLRYKVKAGDFENVCKVETRAFLYDKESRKLRQLKNGGFYYYYAPYVGLIKTEFLDGATFEELLRYQVK